MHIYHENMIPALALAKSAWAVKYTDCFTAVGKTPLQQLYGIWH